ncbi:uncharacterized protein J4E92_010525 [Alternaria infectoria]|uniref:uncharacterized protein n=1 Tax=Alternaria infectoria TaxID=45303 RepID=UPI00221F2D2E|nr:uncharacterized protein J4E92_010525 [Alternaria infectoria]KAI4909909.1 hypothetical protein J4E92_010525 [Alternaria infectoria]
MNKRIAAPDFTKSAPKRSRSSTSSEHSNIDLQGTFQESDDQPQTQADDLRSAGCIASRRANNQATFHGPPSQFAGLVSYGYTALVDAVFNYEFKRRHPKTNDGPDTWRRACVPILASLPDGVLQGIIDGDLAKKYRQGDADLVELYGSNRPSSSHSDESHETSDISTTAWMDNASIVAPGHYVRYFVSPITGLPPTMSELLAIIQTLQVYLVESPSDIEVGLGIDNAKRNVSDDSDIRAGKHKFLCSSSRNPSDARRRILADFCQIVKDRIKAVPSEFLDHRDSRALAYVGYALRVLDRLREHGASAEKSSFIMPLLENTAIYLVMPYRWDSFPVSFAVNADEAALGEMLINGLSLGYTDSGFGVAGHPAGLNVTSTAQAKREHWADALSFRFRYTFYSNNMNLEKERVSKIITGEIAIKAARLKEEKDLQDSIKSKIPDITEAHRSLSTFEFSEDVETSETVKQLFRETHLLLAQYEGELKHSMEDLNVS